MSMRQIHRPQNLLGNVQSRLQTDPPRHTIRKRLFTQRKHNHQTVIDDTGVLDGQDVVVLQRRRRPDLSTKIGQHRLSRVLRMRHLQRHADALHRIHRLIHRRKATGTQLPLDTVLSQPLPNLEFTAGHGTDRHCQGIQQQRLSGSNL